MIPLRRLSLSLLRFRFSGGHHKAPPTRLQKVDEKIIWLNVKNVYGEYERVAAFEGQSLTQAILRSRVDGMRAECQGRGHQIPLHDRPGDPYTYGPGCKTCMVVIREPWKRQIENQLGKMAYEQKNMLTQSDVQDADMRLACYIPIMEWMKEMNVAVLENIDDDDN